MLTSVTNVAKKPTLSAKLDTDLVKKAKLIALSRGIKMSDYLSSLVRPGLERDYPKALKKLNETGVPGADAEQAEQE